MQNQQWSEQAGAVFPAELTTRQQWLVWRFVHKPGQKKPSKMPYYANGNLRGWPNGKPSDGNPTDKQPQVEQGHDLDRAHLVTYDQALAAADFHGFDGVGFAFLPGDGLIGIDLDVYDDPEKRARADAILAACKSWAEVSPSGSGLHIIVKGETETFKHNGIGIEVFCGRQFFTMTGNHIAGTPDTIEPIAPDVLAKLQRTVQNAKDADKAAKAAAQPSAPPPAPAAANATPARDGGSVQRYCQRAYDDAMQRVRNTAEGGRNDALNQEAYGLGRLLHHGVFSEHQAAADLLAAAIACGLPEGEAKATIRSGLTRGIEKPRAIEERTERRLANTASQVPPPNAIYDEETGEILDAPANDNSPAPGHDLAAVDWYSPFPDTNGKGKPLSTIENVREACRRLGVRVRYNVISKEIEILIPGEGFSIDNAANASLAWLTSACSRFGIPTGQLGDFLTYLADRNQFNPVAQWITSKPWDGTSRLQKLFNTIKAVGEEDDLSIGDLKEAMMRRWLISAVAGAFRPNGVAAKGVLVLQGEQNLGKTSWFKSLVPAELGLIQDGLMLRPDDRDSVKQVVSYWMVELGELDATFRKSDIAQLKSFLSRDRDTLRRAYAKLESHYARRTVFFASVNPRQFLHDPTGNIRYWTISCERIDHQHGLDMQQVWAEVYEQHFLKGESWYLAPEEVAHLNAHNKDHEVLDPIRERMLTRLDWGAPSLQWRWMTATDIMTEIGFDRPTKADVTQCGQIALELNGNQAKRSNGKRLSLVPPRSANTH
ncbi:MAG TPA: VapE domain-containing protein [Aquabacterium sp.]|nr:VapE domain-containing protein [Aquabacterium sp.]